MFFGLFLAALGTILWVLGAVVFNLIADLVGGVQVTVLEEELRASDK
jgi:small-conductance mechanosensitive channel